MTFEIKKDNFLKILHWCYDRLDLDSFEFRDNPPRFIFNKENDAILFSLKWSDQNV